METTSSKAKDPQAQPPETQPRLPIGPRFTITGVPSGDLGLGLYVPDFVLKAWIGMTMEADRGIDYRIRDRPGKTRQQSELAFAVNARAAIELLRDSHPEAYRWFANHGFLDREELLFSADYCNGNETFLARQRAENFAARRAGVLLEIAQSMPRVATEI